MAKARTQFVCQNCGTAHNRWVGKCEGCGEWNTVVEEDPMGGIGSGPGKVPKKGRPVALTALSGEIEEAPRIHTGIGELDRVRVVDPGEARQPRFAEQGHVDREGEAAKA